VTAPQLIRDDPAWSYLAPTGPATRRLRVWRTEPGRLVAVVTERGAGMSITNAAETIAAQLAGEHPDDVLEVIEHYPAGIGADEAEHFDSVCFDGRRPRWRRIRTPDMVARFGSDVLDAPAEDGVAHVSGGPSRAAD